MLLMGILGGMLYAAIPALLKIRFGTNEILTSLMLVYVAQLSARLAGARAVARSAGLQLPRQPRLHRLPGDADPHPGSRVHHRPDLRADRRRSAAGSCSAARITGFADHALGQAPRAGAFAGFSRNRMILLAFLISGGLAGLAGICEVAGPVGKLDVVISPGYGFTAIIVAFLGRLNPVGILVAGFVLALSYLGGEAGPDRARHVRARSARVFQGMLLFFVLACDTFILYRMRFVPDAACRRP